MKQEISSHLVTGLAATTGVSAIVTTIMKFFDFYAAGIGAMFTILTFITWVFFQLRHDKKLSLADENKIQIGRVEAQLTNNIERVETILHTLIDEVKKINKD